MHFKYYTTLKQSQYQLTNSLVLDAFKFNTMKYIAKNFKIYTKTHFNS